ncbi:MAG: DUF3137 domain-containing protein [Saprospiraceae bacterium]|nr:DUF3137 domain-containing protein [Saprospiraceae bacterium]
MERLEEFRFFYNHTIYPELLRMERQRLRLVALLGLSFVILAVMIVFELYLGIWVVTLMLTIPHVIFIGFLFWQVRRFRNTFKPNVVDLLLDFIDNGPNFDANFPLSYDAEGGLSKDEFLQSGIFVTQAQYYVAEDAIKGRIGEIEFELCELSAKEISPVRNDLDDVFKGVFLHAKFTAPIKGRIVVWPREQRQYLTRAIKQFTSEKYKGINADHEINNPEFKDLFMTYATPNTYVEGILPDTMQEAILRYYHQTKKNIYFSFHNQDFYVAITQPKDLLEPYILRSNLSYDLVLEFMRDINLVLRIVHEFDQKI